MNWLICREKNSFLLGSVFVDKFSYSIIRRKWKPLTGSGYFKQKYSQTCEQRQALRLKKSVRCSKGGRYLQVIFVKLGIRLAVVNRWPLFRGGHLHRFDCSCTVIIQSLNSNFTKLILAELCYQTLFFLMFYFKADLFTQK